MKLNNHGKIQFLPYNEINFNKDSFGLYPFKKDPLIKVSYNKNPSQIMEKSNNDDLLFTPEKNTQRKMLYIKYSPIGLLTIILSA